MRTMAVPGPLSLLLDPVLAASAKVLWLTLRLEGRPVGATELCDITGISPVTVRKGLSQLKMAGWYSHVLGAAVPVRAQSGQVAMPAGLLQDHRVRPQAKLVYALLQALPGFRYPAGSFSCAALSQLTQLSTVAVRQVVAHLAATGWLDISREHRKAPFQFTLCNPDAVRRKQEVADAAKRLADVQFKNEQIMKEYLSLLVDSDNYADNARIGLLPNPESKHMLELDRYYPPSVGFEYQGIQHYRATSWFPSEAALAKRQFRDAVKRVLCEQNKIRLIAIHRADLSLKGMQAKIGKVLPLRSLRGHEELIAYLDKLDK